MPLFRALAKNMAPMTNADESPTNRLTLFWLNISLFIVSTLCQQTCCKLIVKTCYSQACCLPYVYLSKDIHSFSWRFWTTVHYRENVQRHLFRNRGLTSLLQLVDKLQQAVKLTTCNNSVGVFGWVQDYLSLNFKWWKFKYKWERIAKEFPAHVTT